MKRELRIKNKRKWIVGGIAFFGSVTLLTTGFASWIIGVQLTNTNNQAAVTVDTTSNESIFLKTKLVDNNVKLSENYSEPDSIITSDGEATDFSITFSEISISISQAFVDKNTINSIDFSFAYNVTGVDNNKTSNNKVNVGTLDAFNREGDYTYLDIATPEIDLSTVDWNQAEAKEGFKEHVISNKSVEMFKWGTFFEHKSPCNYYNNLSDIEWSQNKLDAATKELEELKVAFDGGNVVIKAEVNYTVKA